MSTIERLGDWMQLNSGRRFYPVDPRPDEVFIEDIAHGISLANRFAGQCRSAYSVAQHSVLVSRFCDQKDALWGLLHDASEAYIGDITRPLKRSGLLGGYLDAESKLMQAVTFRFGLQPQMPPSVKLADDILLVTEARDLFDHLDSEWESKLAGLSRMAVRIVPWPADQAEREFLVRFREITEQAS